MRARHAVVVGAVATCLDAFPRASCATPQVTSDVSVGGGTTMSPGASLGVFTLALRTDVLFGGDTPYAFRLGPALSVRTDNFKDVAPSLGASVLLPITSTFPLVVSAATVLDLAASTDRVGGLARLWWGTRSYNYHSAYGLTAGVWVEARYFPANVATGDVTAGIDIDLEVFSLGWILLYNWIAH